MVSFVCGNCQDVLKKNKVDSHCVGKCRDAWEFTCIDCNSTFEGFDYKSHNSCITEEEKYCGKLVSIKKPVLYPGKDVLDRKKEFQLLIEKILKKNGSMNWKKLVKRSIKEYMNNRISDSSEDKILKWECLAAIPICYTTKESNMVTFKKSF
ncbi:cell growth-regulating nucleolar [Cryptosporidium sp. chipmunk genotype I]|uniref:cell growth-regulating nucleolar n=1 Tax=Cryptosporidium sp. chipmunk genotype I TaxID=1280935 RepID=UPI00351A08C7|nr:cell growth-regulating nucleolar [Cryptosporidium sp. chipmunk genotype I]